MGFLGGIGRKILQFLIFFVLVSALPDCFTFGLPSFLGLAVHYVTLFLISIVASYLLKMLLGDLWGYGGSGGGE